MKKLLTLCLLLAVAAFAQQPASSPKKTPPARSTISESFAKAGLRALIAVENYDGDGPSLSAANKKEFDEAQAEHDPDKPAEARMLGNIVLFDTLHSINKIKKDSAYSQEAIAEQAEQESKCSSELERAFRHRVSIEAPASCKSDKK